MQDSAVQVKLLPIGSGLWARPVDRAFLGWTMLFGAPGVQVCMSSAIAVTLQTESTNSYGVQPQSERGPWRKPWRCAVDERLGSQEFGQQGKAAPGGLATEFIMLLIN